MEYSFVRKQRRNKKQRRIKTNKIRVHKNKLRLFKLLKPVEAALYSWSEMLSKYIISYLVHSLYAGISYRPYF